VGSTVTAGSTIESSPSQAGFYLAPMRGGDDFRTPDRYAAVWSPGSALAMRTPVKFATLRRSDKYTALVARYKATSPGS
jgi:hypothetical protein